MKSEGSPYISNYSGLKKNLPVGKIFNKNMQHIGSAFVIYNAYTDYMEISAFEDGVDYYQLKALPDYLYIVFRDKKYRAYNYNNKLGYFVILSENDWEPATLLKKEEIIYLKEYKSTGNSFVSDTPAAFRRLKDIYYIKIEGDLHEVSKNKNATINMFKSKHKEITGFIKSKNLKLKGEVDLLILCNYYNSLTKN
ncbi:hypothetical protein [Seonamhaeicola maritimus]|uniref:Uncharacterized protein n=1 Tax=Seonamhaeicola maritimus TaxID=2591822 RepID=A0A5C7GJB1_9FLAO|nr:hypothetical protein [Seonamhaeicola maritimus]TXG37509.1 hypothetical protein FUA22_13260 [Seonamhaeicola maritimus]